MDWMTVAEITMAIVLVEAILAGVRWLLDRRQAEAEPKRAY